MEPQIWDAIPHAARAGLVSVAGGSGFIPVSGGYHGSVVGVLNERLFVKAVPAGDPAFDDFDTETRVAEALQNRLPTPTVRFADVVDGWSVLAFDVARGRIPLEPWQPSQLQVVLDALDAVTDALTPSPVIPLPTVADRMLGRCTTWGLMSHGESRGRLTPNDLTTWERRNLDRLADLEARVETSVAGQTLLHFDLRHDNLFIDDGAVTFLDWGRACIGPAWVDVACLLVESRTVDADLDAIFLGTARGAAADPAEVDILLTLFASYWRHASTLPSGDRPGMQARRRHSAEATIGWLARRWSR